MRCIVRTMIIYTTDSLFAWNRLDDSPDLKTIRDFFELLPDGPLLEALRVNRGRGRNDRPIRVLWFCAVLPCCQGATRLLKQSPGPPVPAMIRRLTITEYEHMARILNRSRRPISEKSDYARLLHASQQAIHPPTDA